MNEQTKTQGGFSPQAVMAAHKQAMQNFQNGYKANKQKAKVSVKQSTEELNKAGSEVTPIELLNEASQTFKFTNKKGSKLNEERELTKPSEMELKLIRDKAAPLIWKKGQKTGYEYCGLICPDGGGGLVLSKIITNGLRFACDTSSLSCPNDSSPVSDVHGHGRDEGTFQINELEAQVLGGDWKAGDWIRKPTQDVFSITDLEYNRHYNINGWMIPATRKGTVLWFPHTNEKNTHDEYKYGDLNEND